VTAPQKWITATLYDFNGHICGRVRVPTVPASAGVVMWANRYFKQRGVTAEYIEAKFYMVPIEQMFDTKTERQKELDWNVRG